MDKINKQIVVQWRGSYNQSSVWVLPALRVNVAPETPQTDYLKDRLSGKTRADIRLQERIARRITQ